MDKIEINADFEEYKQLFLEQNSKLNLISKNEEKYLFEKHIYDSLGIKLFFEKYKFIPKTLLDIGTGGGFPSIPIAMEYPEIHVVGVDSRKKKINAVKELSERLGINNIEFINNRIENIHDRTFELVTSRAVAKIDKLIDYSYPLLKKGGYLVFYKSKGVEEEIDNAKNKIRRYHLKIEPEIEYKLPLLQNYKRVLLILRKQS